MRVGLPMYDLPEFREDHERLWRGLRDALHRAGFADLPDTLEWPGDLFDLWRSPDLLLGQTCGLPLVRELAGVVQFVGVVRYDVPGCDGYNYISALLVARDSPYRSLEDLRGRVAGYNERVSQSGYNTLRYAVAPLAGGKPFFSRVVETGRHEFCMDRILAGTIDVAAVDAITWAFYRRCRPERAAGLRSLGFTVAAPGVPLVTNRAMSAADLDRLRAALIWLFEAEEMAPIRSRLMLSGISFPNADVYQVIVAQAQHAAALGYPDLC